VAPAPATSAHAAPDPTPLSRAAAREEIADELRERRAEIARIEERLLTKDEALTVKLEDAIRKERQLADRARNLGQESETLKTAAPAASSPPSCSGSRAATPWRRPCPPSRSSPMTSRAA
jgi:acyl-CoA reductase-like NAD-dependent aldehyde dehydrogenase